MTPEDIFKEMPASLNADAAKGMNSTIQFNLSGDNGGQWYVTIKDGKAAVPLVTAALPSLMVTYHWPPLSPERLNWIVEFMPLAASAFKLAGISLKISSGVMRAPPLGWGVDAGVLGHAYTRVKNMGEHAR